MHKQYLFKSMTLALMVICMVILSGCGKEVKEPETPQNIADEPNNNQPDPSTDKPISDPNVTSDEKKDDEVAKINGGADEVGIYSIVVKLTDKAADKAVIELVYYGAKGSPQENSVVNTFRIEYYKKDSGKFEIKTFYNNEVYQNMHDKDEVKVVNTFGADLRAGSVIISYTPEGGNTVEIFRADADYFNSGN